MSSWIHEEEELLQGWMPFLLDHKLPSIEVVVFLYRINHRQEFSLPEDLVT